jgi:hypothetical protein
MDLQYHYRCGTHYLNLATSAQNELTEHTLSTGERNTQAILARIKKMVDDKWLNPAILEEPNWSAFRFTYINSLTQWSVFYNMYDRNKPYKKVKSNYLRAVITHSYAPYLTKKGEKAFAELVFNR